MIYTVDMIRSYCSTCPSSTRGFSLLEVIIVLCIMSILALMAVPMLAGDNRKELRSQVNEGLKHVESIKAGVLKYVLLENECPDNVNEDLWEDFGIAAATAFSGHHVNTVATEGELEETGGCLITANFKTRGLNENLAGRHISVRLFGLDQGVPKWACYSNLDKPAYNLKPFICRFPTPEAAEAAQAPE